MLHADTSAKEEKKMKLEVKLLSFTRSGVWAHHDMDVLPGQLATFVLDRFGTRTQENAESKRSHTS